MNQIVLIGRLTADPVLEKTESGVSKCKFSLGKERIIRLLLVLY